PLTPADSRPGRRSPLPGWRGSTVGPRPTLSPLVSCVPPWMAVGAVCGSDSSSFRTSRHSDGGIGDEKTSSATARHVVRPYGRRDLPARPKDLRPFADRRVLDSTL